MVAVLLVVAVGYTSLVAAVTGEELILRRVDEVPTSPAAPVWGTAPVQTKGLDPQQMVPPFGGGSIDEVQVQAMTDGDRVAFRLSWEDPTRDADTSEPDRYSDAAAILLHGGMQPPITMGGVGTPVNIWYWRAAWQARVPLGHGSMYTYPHPDNGTRPGTQAGNPMSTPPDGGAQSLYAEGFGSLSIASVQNVHTEGGWTGDGWQVVFWRSRSAGGPHDADFQAAETMFVTVAVWDGSAGDVDGQKNIAFQFSTVETGGQAPPSQPPLPELGTRELVGLGGLAILAGMLAFAAWAIRSGWGR